MLSGICFLLSACSEQEDYENLINNAPKEKDLVEVNLRLSLQSEMKVEGNTDYHPMSTRAEGDGEEVLTVVSKFYKCLVMKEISGVWYVDSSTTQILIDKSDSKPIEVTNTTSFKNLQLTLRPGHYRILAVLNPRAVKWNKKLVPGTVVKGKGEEDTIACAYTYNIIPKYQTVTTGPRRRYVNYEVFAGTADFTVSKTEDLHSTSISGDTDILFTRRVMQIRFLLKDYKPVHGYYFHDTEHFIDANISTQDRFCDGLNCWGDAYYNRTPTQKIELYTDTHSEWRTAKNGNQYLMIARNVTNYSPFVFTDPKKTVAYQMEDIWIHGQSEPGQTYAHLDPIQNLELKNDTIQQIVFQLSDETPSSNPSWHVTLDYLKEESTAYLFENNYECNLPYEYSNETPYE